MPISINECKIAECAHGPLYHKIDAEKLLNDNLKLGLVGGGTFTIKQPGKR